MSDLSSPNAIGSGGAGNTTGYYDSHHNGFSATNGGGSTESILYDSITTISQAQSSLYTPPLVSSLGKLFDKKKNKGRKANQISSTIVILTSL